MKYSYYTKGTCSRQIIFEVNDKKVSNVHFIGGCSGNSQGISKLVNGMEIDKIINKLKGIQCRNGTSCPDQLAQALIQFKEENNL